MGVCFHLLANGTPFDIFSDISAYSGPPVISFDQFLHLELARVSSNGVIMVKYQDLLSKMRGNICAIAEICNAIFNSPVSEVRPCGWCRQPIQSFLYCFENWI